MRPKLNESLRILGDGWWRVAGIPVLETDKLKVTDLNDDGCVITVERDGAVLGTIDVYWTFVEQDFEIVKEEAVHG